MITKKKRIGKRFMYREILNKIARYWVILNCLP